MIFLARLLLTGAGSIIGNPALIAVLAFTVFGVWSWSGISGEYRRWQDRSRWANHVEDLHNQIAARDRIADVMADQREKDEEAYSRMISDLQRRLGNAKGDDRFIISPDDVRVLDSARSRADPMARPIR